MTAAALAAAGATVIGTATSQPGAEGISAALGDQGRGIVLNVADPDSVAAAIKDIQGNEGSPTILVNNAGLARGLAPLHEGEIEDWEEMIDANLKGLLYVTRTVLPGMVARPACSPPRAPIWVAAKP